MREKFTRYCPLAIALILAAFCCFAFTIYAKPMEDVSLDLSLAWMDNAALPSEAKYDSKGWTVYTQEGETKVELTPDGFGGYSGLELGQTFYYSRVMEEDLDSPTLQLGTAERNFVVFLDDIVIYSDCPELDNRIGYMRLPMHEYLRDDPIIISLPADYQGKTLTIAQSFPEWSETSRVKAFPASVRLYCGYAYESGLISESFQTALISAVSFALILVLLTAFVRNRDWAILCLAAVVFCTMASRLSGVSFSHRYFDTSTNSSNSILPLIPPWALLTFLSIRGGTHRKKLSILLIVYSLSVVAYSIVAICFPRISTTNLIADLLIFRLPYWIAFILLCAIMVLGTVCWRKENRFYRIFIPMAYAGMGISWLVEIIRMHPAIVWQQIIVSISSVSVHYLLNHTLNGIAVAALIAAIAEAIKTELDRRAEQHLMEQRKEMTMASYENLRRQHEEVMMMRHDMLRHFRTLHDMGGDEKRTAYLADLIGQNQRIRPVVESGNEMLDIILNGKLSVATDAGIRVEIPHVNAPASLPLSDPDLCGLVMNIVDNAITAASAAAEQYILLKIHERDGFLGIVCENSFTPQDLKVEAKKETVPKHGLGLKIVRGIVAKYSGAITENTDGERFTVKIVIPL